MFVWTRGVQGTKIFNDDDYVLGLTPPPPQGCLEFSPVFVLANPPLLDVCDSRRAPGWLGGGLCWGVCLGSCFSTMSEKI